VEESRTCPSKNVDADRLRKILTLKKPGGESGEANTVLAYAHETINPCGTVDRKKSDRGEKQ